jgi:predicted DNA-binding transcriptional regulator AlpA
MTQPILEDRLIDVKETAYLLCVSVKTVRRYSEAGLLPAPKKVGSALRWRLSDIRAWIAERDC